MTNIIACPKCKSCPLEISISGEWLHFSETPAFCRECDKVVWIKFLEDSISPPHTSDDPKPSWVVALGDDEIPPFELGFKVRVIDEHSYLYGKVGYVIDKDHIHYRVKVGPTLLWVPEHWVKKA